MPNTSLHQTSMIVPSPAMMPPQKADMLNKRNYCCHTEPPSAHARLWGEPENGLYFFNYNGFDIVELRLSNDIKTQLRYHSDGNFLSSPFTQQFIVASEVPVSLRMVFRFPGPIINIRPHRALKEEAILAQWGTPLLYGVNGIYSIDWDLLISIHGYPFKWTSSRIIKKEDSFEAELSLQLDSKPMVLLFRPRFYGKHLGFPQHEPWDRQPKSDAITGWCSWEAYHSAVTQQDIENAVKAITPLKKYGMEYVQLDDGYQNELVPPAIGEPIGNSWINTNDKFPGGHHAVVSSIIAAGLKAGIWTNATLTNYEACEDSSYCLRDRDGRLIKGDWIQYVINCSEDMLEQEITPYYRKLRDAGYTYFKSDSLRHLLYDGLHEAVRLGLMSSTEAEKRFTAYMRAARRGIGEDSYYLSCWGVLSPSIGICDAMRVATDANPSWRAFSMQIRESARWFFAQRILFTVDPDHICVRAELPWVRMMLSLVSLTGGLFMISDKPEFYDKQRLELIQRTIPALPIRTAETGMVEYNSPACASSLQEDLNLASMELSHLEDSQTPFSSLWCTHFDTGSRAWAVVHRVAVVPLNAIELSVEAFALDPSRRYCAFDFWEQKPRIILDGKIQFDSLPLGHNSVVALHDITEDNVVVVGSSRHVSMDAVSINDLALHPTSVSMSLSGFPGLEVIYTIYAPSRELSLVECVGCEITTSVEEPFVQLRVLFVCEKANIVMGIAKRS